MKNDSNLSYGETLEKDNDLKMFRKLMRTIIRYWNKELMVIFPG